MTVLAAVMLVAVLLPLGGQRAAAAAAMPTISGRMYNDAAVNGVYDASDPGVANAVVRAFDDSGAEIATATTAADGTYTITLPSAQTGTVRVEFPIPTGLTAAMVSDVANASGSSIQFVAPGATNVNFGVFDASNYCQISSIASVCMSQGSLSYLPNNKVLGLSPWSPATKSNPLDFKPIATDQTGALTTTLSKWSTTGATWGLAYQQTTGLIWNSAFIRRHAALGPKGLGGLYVTDRSGNQVASFDVTTAGITLQDPTKSYTNTMRDIRDDLLSHVSATDGTTVYATRPYLHMSRDIPGYSAVGKVGIGDIDITSDGQYLWLTNLYERKIHRIALGGTASAPTLGAVQSWNVDDGHTCAGSTSPLRPFGLDPRPDGKVVVVAVCTNENADALTKPLPGAGVVMTIDPSATGAAAFTELATISFAIPHSFDNCVAVATSTNPLTCTWKAWSDDWTKMMTVARKSNQTQYWWTQPMPINIVTLADGSFVIGISDRMSYQGGFGNYEPTEESQSGYVQMWTAGQTMLLCKTATGWLQESNGKCVGTTNYNSSRPEGFFEQVFGHPKTTIGGLALGGDRVAIASMDPADYFTGGIRWDSLSTGSQVNALNLWAPNNTGANGGNPAFGKSAGMGDLEAICDGAPLQIGNRVWYDIDGDGIQDPGEAPVVGATVRLYDGATLVATAVTNAKGEYYFTSTLTEPANGGTTPDAFGGNLAPGVAYTIKMDNAADCGNGGMLEGWSLTQTTAGTNTLIDSNATGVGTSWCTHGTPTVTVAALAKGTVDHSFDIGFHVPSVFVGDFVWVDSNDNGTLDADEPGLAGVTLTLTDANGAAVTDVLGDPVGPVVTDALGRYRFDLLPVGTYKVTVTPPTGYALVSGQTATAQSVALSTLGGSDLTLDFGLRLTAGAAATTTTTSAGSATTTTVPGSSSTPTTAPGSSTTPTTSPGSSATTTTVASATTTTVLGLTPIVDPSDPSDPSGAPGVLGAVDAGSVADEVPYALPFTGTEVTMLFVVACALLGGGAVIVMTARRQRPAWKHRR